MNVVNKIPNSNGPQSLFASGVETKRFFHEKSFEGEMLIAPVSLSRMETSLHGVTTGWLPRLVTGPVAGVLLFYYIVRRVS